MRTFIAIDIPPTQEIQDLLIDLAQNLKGLELKYTELKNFHITLTFLGEASEYQVKNLCNGLQSLKHDDIEITLQGLNIFKNNHNPQTIWIGVNTNESLNELWHQVNQSISALDFESDARGFSPHLTIGRVKKATPNHNLTQFADKYRSNVFGKLNITEFILYQSVLTPQGPNYKPIRKFALISK